MPQHNDDIMVRDGDQYTNGVYYPSQPRERTEEEQAEKATIALSAPILPQLLDWFTEQIEDANKIENIQLVEMSINGNTYSRTVSIEAQLLAYQLLHDKLVEKRAEFKDFAERVDHER